MTEEWTLEEVFASIHRVPTSRALQNVIYVAQELGTLTAKYEFLPSGGSFALPYSPEVENDLFRLEYENVVFDTRKGNSLVLRKTLEPRLEKPVQQVLIQLAKLELGELDSLTAVAWARRILSDSVPGRELPDRVADYLVVNRESVDHYLNMLERFRVT
jgi:hypothetical protein